MPDIKVDTNKRVEWRLGPDTNIADYTKPTLAEIVSLTNISEAVRMEGTDFNLDASEQQDDRSFVDAAGAQSRGFSQFGGALALFTPQPTDTTSIFRTARTMLKTPWVKLALAMRVVSPNSTAPAAGNEYNVFRVMVDGNHHERGEVSFAYTINLLPQDDVGVGAILPTASPTAATIAPSGAVAGSVGGRMFLKATYEGRNVTAGATWTSSAPNVVDVDNHGIARYLAAGSASITVQYPGGLASTAKVFTIT